MSYNKNYIHPPHLSQVFLNATQHICPATMACPSFYWVDLLPLALYLLALRSLAASCVFYTFHVYTLLSGSGRFGFNLHST